MNKGNTIPPFPDDFMWGADLPGHRIEGENFSSDWWRWEQRPRRIQDHSTSKTAVDHWKRYKSDLDLARDFGLNTLLVTIEWSRIQPERGKTDTEVLAHYQDVIKCIRDRGIEPVCILQHVTLPDWFAEDYGWAHPDAPGIFEAYVDETIRVLGEHVRRWIPIAEPMHWITMAYHERLWPAKSTARSAARRSIHNMARAHARAYHIIHENRDDAWVGAAIRARHFIPHDPWSAWDARMVIRETRRCNSLYLDALTTGKWTRGIPNDESLKGTLDFIGCAYYGSERLRMNVTKMRGGFAETVDEAGLPAHSLTCEPAALGLSDILYDLSRYALPILITGNGLAHAHDETRCGYLLDHVAVIRHALERNIPVRGYIWHALLDGFEWTEGMKKRYGLMHVDYKKLTRTPNQIAFLYKEICETGTVRLGTVSRFCPGWTPNDNESSTSGTGESGS